MDLDPIRGGVIEISGNKSYIKTQRNKYQLISFSIFNVENPVGIREYFDVDKIKLNKADPEVKKLNERLSLITNVPILIDRMALLENLDRSKCYGVFYDFPERTNELDFCNFFPKSLLEEKRKKPDFKFPSVEEVIEINKDAYSLRLPMSLLRCLENMGLSAYPPEISQMIQQEVLDALDDPEGYQAALTSQLSNYGKKAVTESLLLLTNKDLKFFNLARQKLLFRDEVFTIFFLYYEKKSRFECF